MPHDTPLIATIVAGLGLAFVLGALANRLRIPPLVGYLVAGVMVGPHTPGFVADQDLANQLAEIGVILLMFGVGLHFSLKDLLSVRAVALPGAVAQIGVATLLGLGLALLLGWGVTEGLVFGLALSVASTVVLLRALQERRLTETERGKIAVGWLIVEDLVMVLALVLLPALASLMRGEVEPDSHSMLAAPPEWGILGIIGVTLAKVTAFVLLMMLVGRRAVPWVLHFVAHSGSRELFRLAVLALALCVAFGASKLFDVSLALGAFFAGMVLAESQLSHRAAEESLPLRVAFAVLFFVSVGMLFDPLILIESPLTVLATLFIIVVGKSVASFFIVLAFRHPVGTALTISASLAQIGEFSFILADLGLELGMIPEAARDLILAGAILSIMLNPLTFACVQWLRPPLERVLAGTVFAPPPEPSRPVDPGTAEERLPAPTDLSGHVVLVGYGRVGGLVGEALLEDGTPFFVIEVADDRLTALRERGVPCLSGNAVHQNHLAVAAPERATSLIVAIPDAFEAGQVIAQARWAAPGIHIVARAHSDAEVEHLRTVGADIVIMGEREIARRMIRDLRGTATPEAPGAA